MSTVMEKYKLLKDLIQILSGSVIFAISLNLFLIPSHVYSGGFMGIAQLLRDAVQYGSGTQYPFDIAGILNFILNIVMFLFAYRNISKRFAYMTVFTITMQSIMLSIIPVTALISDLFMAILVGSVLCAFATVIIFNAKGSGGGIDVIGIWLCQKNRGSIGKLYALVNTTIYLFTLLFYDIETALYSVISCAILSFTVDVIHKRNIEVELMVFSEHCEYLKNEILLHKQRGMTIWNGYGGYTSHKKQILVSVITKDEVASIVSLISENDPDAFVIVSKIQVYGNFKKQLVT